MSRVPNVSSATARRTRHDGGVARWRCGGWRCGRRRDTSAPTLITPWNCFYFFFPRFFFFSLLFILFFFFFLSVFPLVSVPCACPPPPSSPQRFQCEASALAYGRARVTLLLTRRSQSSRRRRVITNLLTTTIILLSSR